METLYIKNHLQFRERVKKGMLFRRSWHYQDASILDRKIVDVQVNGMWVKEQGLAEPLWVDFMKAKDWAFKDGKIYMVFNPDIDKKRQEKILNQNDYNRYLKRLERYITCLDNPNIPKINGYKILGVYEIVSE